MVGRQNVLQSLKKFCYQYSHLCIFGEVAMSKRKVQQMQNEKNEQKTNKNKNKQDSNTFFVFIFVFFPFAFVEFLFFY